ncbi:MAG: S-layer protein, partial [Candidatus Aenigmarchaeota archaeon]|nr:S-layer protein [Candidatus Aenigmarchaeota archaeon]
CHLSINMKDKYYILKSGKRNEITPLRVFDNPSAFKVLSNPLGWKIFRSLSKPVCPMDLAKSLGIHEQKVYYYFRKFRDMGLVEEIRSEARHGTLAKFYRIKDHSFALMLDNAPKEEMEITPPGIKKNLYPFIKERKINFMIIVGSPDPHGPWKERALDSPTAIDLGLFLGSFTNAGHGNTNYKLDIEVRENDLRNNLILVGGPVANTVTQKINDSLPVYFDTRTRNIVSKLSKKSYNEEENGFISMIQNPWDNTKKILVFAGKRFPGTRAAVLAFIKDIDMVMEGNRFDRASKSRVVRGYDMNGDGIIDSFEILE